MSQTKDHRSRKAVSHNTTLISRVYFEARPSRGDRLGLLFYN
jgi:hypothetical protein